MFRLDIKQNATNSKMNKQKKKKKFEVFYVFKCFAKTILYKNLLKFSAQAFTWLNNNNTKCMFKKKIKLKWMKLFKRNNNCCNLVLIHARIIHKTCQTKYFFFFNANLQMKLNSIYIYILFVIYAWIIEKKDNIIAITLISFTTIFFM